MPTDKEHNQNSAASHVTLRYFIARLAETIVLSEHGSPCDMCVIGSCDTQVSGMVCLNGVSTWLLKQAKAFDSDAAEREKAYFSYLDSLSESQLHDAVSLMEYRFPHFKMSVTGVQTIIAEWRARKGCSLS